MKKYVIFTILFFIQTCTIDDQINNFYRLLANNNTVDVHKYEKYGWEVKSLCYAFNKINIKPKYEIATNLNQIRTLYYNLEFKKALDSISSLLKKLNRNIELEALIYEEIKYIKNRIHIYNRNLESIELDSVQNDITNLPFHEKYIILNQEYIRALLHSKRDETFEAFSMIHLALFQILNDRDKGDLELLYAKFIALKAEIIIQENNEYYSLGIKLSNQAINIFKKHKAYDEELIAWCNLASIYELNGDNTKLSHCVNVIQHQKVETRIGEFYQNLKLAVLLDRMHIIKIRNYLEKARKIMENDKCSYFSLVVNNLLVDFEHKTNDGNRIDKLAVSINCGEIIHNLSKFYLLEEKIKLMSKEAAPQVIINWLLERRKLAGKVFKNKETFHLDDFYTSNTLEIFKQFKKHPALLITNNNMEKLIELFYETKGRSLETEKYFDKIENHLKKFAIDVEKINSTLMKIDDFKKEDLNMEEYKYLYNLYSIKNQQLQDENFNYNIDTSQISLIIEKTKEQPLIDFLYSNIDSTYFYYTIYNNKVDIGTIGQNEIKKLVNLRATISRVELKKEFFNFYQLFSNIKENNIVGVIPDNEISILAFDLIEPLFGKIKLYNTLNDYSQDKFISLEKYNSVYFSYSNNETLKQFSKIDIAELKYSFEEVKLIKSMMLGRAYMGTQFDLQSFYSLTKSSIAHISTHAHSGENRQDCYFYCRDKGLPKKIYGYELLKLDNLPLFVNLSGCNSAQGKQIIGQGIFSLSHYFFNAGTKSVIKTLWPINDYDAWQFNKLFYKYWMSGCSNYESIVLAKSDLKDYKKHNYNWAAFVLEGYSNVYLH